jgi:hypothetical protein
LAARSRNILGMTARPAWTLFTSRCSAVGNRLAPVAPGLLAAASVLALLLAFQHVVASAVRESEARHRSNAERAAALWRCNSARGTLRREGCAPQASAVVQSATLP